MRYDGVVLRVNDILYLFILDPDTNKIRDGINISDHECYKDLNDDKIVVVNVLFKDGTKDIDKIDLDEFIYGDTYGRYDTFILISDVITYLINTDEFSLERMISDGKLNELSLSCIDNSRKIILKNDE